MSRFKDTCHDLYGDYGIWGVVFAPAFFCLQFFWFLAGLFVLLEIFCFFKNEKFILCRKNVRYFTFFVIFINVFIFLLSLMSYFFPDIRGYLAFFSMIVILSFWSVFSNVRKEIRNMNGAVLDGE